MRRVVALLVLGACGDPGTVVAPVIELPEVGSEADPSPLDEVELSVARVGSPGAIVLATFARDQALALDGVPFESDLVVHLVGRRDGADVGYGRTCPFDLADNVDPPSPHLWFTRTLRWAAATPAPVASRTGGQIWTATDGALVVALGEANGTPATEIDRYDALTGSWTTVIDVSPRLAGVVAALGDGRAVLVGGHDDAGERQAVIEVVDPTAPETARVVPVIDDRLGVDATAAATLASGDVVVIGGRDAAGPIGTVWILRPTDLAIAPPRQLDTAVLATPRSEHTVTRLGAAVGAPLVVIGGTTTGADAVGAAELFRPLGEEFSPTFSAALSHPRRRHLAAALPDGSVLVIGGIDASGAGVAVMERFSLDGGFTDAGALPAGAGLIDASLTTLADGRFLLSGGRTSTTGLPAAGAYVIALDEFDGSIDVTGTDDLEQARAGHVAALLCDGTVLAIGGEDEPTAERYQPPATDRR